MRADYERARDAYAKLSDTEAKVVDMICAGRQNRSIARTMDLSVRTIENHRARAYAKYGVEAAAELGFLEGVRRAWPAAIENYRES